MAVTTFDFAGYNNDYTYDKWDVVWGVTVTDRRFFYSTVNSNQGNNPVAQFWYIPTQSTRTSDEVMRISFTQTGTQRFRQGSFVEISGVVPDGTANYTGVILGGGDGYVDFLSPGLTTTNVVTAGRGAVHAMIHPNWTTGMWWFPSYNSDITSKQLVVATQLGDGYSQRFNPVINSNSLAWTLTYENRTNKEVRALVNFLQDKGGVIPFVMSFPIGNVTHRNNLKYIAGEPRLTLNSFGINTLTVDVQEVFDTP